MMPALADATRKTHVERWRVQIGGAQRAQQRAQPRFEGRLDLGADAVDSLTVFTPLVGRGLAQTAENFGELALLTQNLGARVAKLLLGGSSLEGSARARSEGREARLDVECRVGHGVRRAVIGRRP